MRRKKLIVDTIKIVCYCLLSFLSVLLVSSTVWLTNYFGNLNFSEIYYQILVPMKGTSSTIMSKYMIDCLPISFIISIFFVVVIFKTITKDIIIKFRLGRLKGHFVSKASLKKVVVLLILIISCMSYSLHSLKFDEFLSNRMVESDFIKTNYVNPKYVDIKFPKQKRNLIYIYLESMETTYEDMNLIPELTKLREDNVTFNSTHGAYAEGNSTWTVAAMTAQTAGIPLNIAVEGNSMNLYDEFLPGVYNLGDILEANGYNNYLMLGSDATYGGRRNLFVQHGNYDIWDLNSAIANGDMKASDAVWWGFDDGDLFKYAKRELSAIDKSQPFNFTTLTTDTHHIEGYVEDWCSSSHDSHYANAISCSSMQVVEFINWIEEQDWFDNTTIVISGDHPSMNNTFFTSLPTGYIRTVYTTIINPASEYEEGNREYSTYDLFPTTLASLGVNIDGNRLGLGTNLFSKQRTLTEEYGLNYINSELLKKSTYYDDIFFNGHAPTTSSN